MKDHLIEVLDEMEHAMSLHLDRCDELNGEMLEREKEQFREYYSTLELDAKESCKELGLKYDKDEPWRVNRYLQYKE